MYNNDKSFDLINLELGLPNLEDIIPLSQCLIPPKMAAAFNIKSGPGRSMMDVERAAKDTFDSIMSGSKPPSMLLTDLNLMPFHDDDEDDEIMERNDELGYGEYLTRDDSSESRKLGRNMIESGVEEEKNLLSLQANKECNDMSGKGLKRPRLEWTSMLHKRFIDVIAHLGIKKAAPKNIMYLMNVEGLTRKNVASHLQKYRLYLKRKVDYINEGSSASHHLFASAPLSLLETSEPLKGHMNKINVPMPYLLPQMNGSMPVIGLGHVHEPVGMPLSLPGPSYQYNIIPCNDKSLQKFAAKKK